MDYANYNFKGDGVNARFDIPQAYTIIEYVEVAGVAVAYTTLGNTFILDAVPANDADIDISVNVIPAGDTIAELTDVDTSGASAGEVLTFNGTTSTWEPVEIPTPVSTLDGLSDVVAPTPGVGDMLVWDGTNWVNSQTQVGSETVKVLAADTTYNISTAASTLTELSIAAPGLPLGIYEIRGKLFFGVGGNNACKVLFAWDASGSPAGAARMSVQSCASTSSYATTTTVVSTQDNATDMHTTVKPYSQEYAIEINGIYVNRGTDFGNGFYVRLYGASATTAKFLKGSHMIYKKVANI